MGRGSIALLLAAAFGVAAMLTFFTMNWALGRASRRGAYGDMLGSFLGVSTRLGDPFGLTEGLPPTGGRRTPISTGRYGEMGMVAVVEEQGSSASSTVCYLWIHAGMDADILRGADASTERTHATRGGLADRVVKAIGTSVPRARLVWATVGSAPPPARDDYDRASSRARPIGLIGDGPFGAVGLALRADLVTNPVAWLRWLRAVIYAEQDGVEAPAPPAVGFG